MKLVRVILACTLLLLAATPSFALNCFTCNEFEINQCDWTPGSGTRCRFHIDYCETISAPSCLGLAPEAQAAMVLEDWSVASIEISRPAENTKVVTASNAVAQSVTAPIADLQ